MATRKPRRFADGGSTEAADKEAGLKASKGENVGFFERLRMGNIDQEGSEAYKRFGAGRGRAERVPVVDMAPTSRGIGREAAPEITSDQYLGTVKPGPQVPAATTVTPSAAASGKPSDSRNAEFGMSRGTRASDPRDAEAGMSRGTGFFNPRDLEAGKSRGMRGEGPPKMNMGKAPAVTTRQRVEAELDSMRPTAEQTQKGLEAASMLMGGASLKSLNKLAKTLANTGKGTTRTPAQQAFERAQMADRLKPARGNSPKEAEKAAREAKTLNPLAWMAGPKGMRDEFKRGGTVKKMAGGGMTSMPASSGASRRADGIATKGKTRGKIC